MEGTSTLADALLDDLDDLSDGEEEVAEEERSQEELGGDGAHTKHTPGMPSGDALVSRFIWGADSGKPASSSTGPKKSVRLLDDATFQGHLQLVNDELARAGTDSKQPPTAVAAVELLDDRHELLVNSNRYLIASMDELDDAHKSLCEAYHPKFPELEELLPNATQYVKSVGIIGNATDLTHKTIQDGLAKILTNHQIMTLTVSESTSDGRPLTNEEFQRVQAITLYMEEIIRVQSRLVDYIEKHMERLAPSVCALIGPRVAAKLLAMTGDLAALSKIPSCNLQVLGQVKQSRATHSTHHEGVLMECDLVQRCAKPMRRKALKVVAAKLALAIRCDYVNYESGRPRSARSGLALRQEIEQKFVKLQEPDKAPVLKALPKPDLTVKKRRGGKRMRRLKERYEETALMKQANTRAFSTQAGEYGDDAMGLTLGLLDTGDTSGAVRKNTQKRQVKFANTRASRKKAAIEAKASTTNTSGLATSMVFTPVQGMEFVNPDAQKDRVREANKKWFSKDAGFHSALPKK